MTLSKSILGLTVGLTLVSTALFAAPAATLTSQEMGTLATVATIDISEILVGTVAENRTKNDDVQNLAKMMLDQHGSNLNRVLAMDKNAEAFSSSLSQGTAQKLLSENKKDLAKLGQLQGEKFDHAYVDAMVTGHQGALKLIDTKLMKTATSPDVKAFLNETKEMVQHHLDASLEVQKKLGS